MRELRLQTPNMSGPDVSDWQAFLKSGATYQGIVDGQFGIRSCSATRLYQTNAGLTVDGVVGNQTMARAIEDGYRSTTGANVFGMDASTSCGDFAGDILGQSMKFVARYYCSDTGKKLLTVDEAQKLSNAGLSIVVVFEDSNDSATFFSAEIGTAQATRALQLAAGVGQPPDTAIYFAVDYDATQADVTGVITDYFQALNSVMNTAAPRYAIGVYGSGLTCRVIHDAGLARFTWLAQSTGFTAYSTFRQRADIVQLGPSRDLSDGLEIDDAIGQSADFGAFQLPLAQHATNIPT